MKAKKISLDGVDRRRALYQETGAGRLLKMRIMTILGLFVLGTACLCPAAMRRDDGPGFRPALP